MVSPRRETVPLAPSPAAKRNHETVPKGKTPLGRSKRVHDFRLPVLKWRGTRIDVRSDRADAGGHPDFAFPVQVQSDGVIRAIPSLAVETKVLPSGSVDTGYSEIKEFGEKLLDDLRWAWKTEFGLLERGELGGCDKDMPSVPAPWHLRGRSKRRLPDELGDSTQLDGTASSSASTPESDNFVNPGRCLFTETMESWPQGKADTGGGQEDHSSAARTWNSRRMQTRSKPSDMPLPRVAPVMTSTAAAVRKATINLAKSSRLRSSRRKLTLELTKEEVDHDWLAITGSRPSRRPTKRPRKIQNQLDSCFPGSFLWAVTPEMYRVSHPLK